MELNLTKISAAKRTISEATQRKEGRQLERLFDLLPDDLFDTVKAFPYAARLRIEKWHLQEASRLAPVMSRTVGGAQYNSLAVIELLDILAADPPDLQQAGSWLAAHRDELSALLLAQLVSAAMGLGVVNLHADRSDKRHGSNREKKVEALRLWRDEYQGKEKMTKGKAAPLIAKTVDLVPSTVRRYLRGL